MARQVLRRLLACRCTLDVARLSTPSTAYWLHAAGSRINSWAGSRALLHMAGHVLTHRTAHPCRKMYDCIVSGGGVLPQNVFLPDILEGARMQDASAILADVPEGGSITAAQLTSASAVLALVLSLGGAPCLGLGSAAGHSARQHVNSASMAACFHTSLSRQR